MPATKSKLAVALPAIAIAVLLTAALGIPGHFLMHLQANADIALAAILFPVICGALLIIRGLKMDTSYTL